MRRVRDLTAERDSSDAGRPSACEVRTGEERGDAYSRPEGCPGALLLLIGIILGTSGQNPVFGQESPSPAPAGATIMCISVVGVAPPGGWDLDLLQQAIASGTATISWVVELRPVRRRRYRFRQSPQVLCRRPDLRAALRTPTFWIRSGLLLGASGILKRPSHGQRTTRTSQLSARTSLKCRP